MIVIVMKLSSETEKGVVSLAVVILSFAIFLIFINNTDYIVESSNFNLFVVLAGICLGLMVGLLYLVSNRAHVSVRKSSSHRKRRR